MYITAQYDKAKKIWFAYFNDNVGQLGPTVAGPTKELAYYSLGREMGEAPHKFARPIDEYMAAYAEEQAA